MCIRDRRNLVTLAMPCMLIDKIDLQITHVIAAAQEILTHQALSLIHI